MAVRGELYSKIKDQIDAGNMRAAYRTFEQLPIKDQIAISVTPGVGDAIAAYEVGEFGRRARTNIQEDDRLGAAGNIALLGLAGLSLYPLFRFLRGAKGLKSVPKKTEKPPVEEPSQPSAPKETPETPEIPDVQPFQPKGIEETSFRTGLGFDDGRGVEFLDEIVLGSKARKWINGIDQPKIKPLGKKIQKLPIEQWKTKLEQAGVPKGELRLLKILNESNELHPKLINEAAGAKSVSREFIDDYMARSQRNAINIRNTPRRLLESSSQRPDNIDNATQGQLNYFVRGSGEFRQKDIHNREYTANSQDAINDLTGKNMYVFDGFGLMQPGARLRNVFGDLPQNQRDEIDKIFKELEIDETSKGTNIFRMQSDFQREARDIREDLLSPHRRAKETLDKQIRSYYTQGNILEKLNVLRGSQAENLRKSIDPEFFQAMSGGEEMLKKYLGPKLYAQVSKNYDKEIVDILDELDFPPDLNDDLFEALENAFVRAESNPPSGSKDTIIELMKDFEFFKVNPARNEEIAQLFISRNKAANAFKEKVMLSNPTGFIKPALMKKLIKSLKVYDDKVSRLNKAQLKGKEFDDALDELNQDILNLGIDSFVFSPKDLARATGKPFEESLPLSPREIFYATDARGRQKYINVANDDMSLSKAYFDDIIDEYSAVFEAGDGIKILKKAAGLSAKERGFKIDPYFDGGNTKYFKLPVRTQVLKAAKNNEDFVYIGQQRAASESLDTDLVRTYQDAQKELGKILDELNVDKKDVLKTIEGTGTEFDGTYLKLTDEIKEKIRKLGINAFKKGGAVESDNIKSTYKLPNNIKNNVFKIINTDIQKLHEDVVRPKFKKLGIDRSETQLKKDYSFFGDTSYNAYYVLADAYLDGKITQDDIYEYFRKVQPENYLDKDGSRYKNMQNMFNASDPDSYFSDIINSVKTQKEAEKQYLALLKRLKKDHNVTVLDYEYGNPQNKRQKITDFMFQVGGEKPRANVIMARPFIDPSGEAIINMPVTHDFKEKLRTLNEELFHVGQFRDEQLTGKPIDRLRNVKYLMPLGIRGLIPNDPNLEFLYKLQNEALKDAIGFKLGTHSHQYGRYHDPEAIEGIHRDYKQSEEYLKQFGLSTTDPESFTYRDPKSERFFENPRKQYAGFAEGGEVPSQRELARISKAKIDEIEAELQNILEFRIYDNLLKGGTLDELYQDYDAAKDIKENIIDTTESKLRESLKIPYKDEIIDILQSDDPRANLEQRLDVFGTKQIDRALQSLNLPIDVRKTQRGTKFGKDIYDGDKFNIDFTGYKPDDGDFTGDIDFRYRDAGRFGNIDIQSSLDELGDIDTYGRYGYTKGPFDVRAQKYPGRDITGDVSYTLEDIKVGQNQTLGVRAMVDQLKRVKFNLDYLYDNPEGGFFQAGLGLSNRGSPQLNIEFGKQF